MHKATSVRLGCVAPPMAACAGGDPGGGPSAWPGRLVERERELDWYRQAVEDYLGSWLAFLEDEQIERFFEHVERCFDWGISAPACGRTWIAKIEAASDALMMREG